MKKYKKVLVLPLIPFVLSSCKNEEVNQNNSSNEIKQNEQTNENTNNIDKTNNGENGNNATIKGNNRVNIIATRCFEVDLYTYKNNYSEKVFFLSSNEDFVSLCDYYNENSNTTKDESFISFLDEIERVHFEEYPFIVCPFKFSSSETDIRLTSLSYDESKYYVGFDAKTPNIIDCDIRVCYFFSQIEKESFEALMSKECEYVIRNLLGGEGSAYYH